MSESDPVDLETFVRTHHVRFEVQPEVTFAGDERLTVGYRLSLWAAHEKGARALPGCPKCTALVQGLQRLAQEAVPTEARPTKVEIEPFEPALYDSTAYPGVDEVRIEVRLTHRQRYEAPIDACEDRCLREMRDRLKRRGVKER